MSVWVGLDVGGTKLVVASADEHGAVLRRSRAETPLDLDDGLDQLHNMIAEVVGDQRIAGIGVAIGGPLDWQRGVVSPLHQPRWRDVPLQAIMEARYGCPLRLDVDTNVAALGEYVFGGDRVAKLLYLTLSTGMGGGLIVDGEIYRGIGGAHPEVGHQTVAFRCSRVERVQCPCGATNCLEALVSGKAIRRIYGVPAEKLGEDEWSEVAFNLGQGLRNVATIYAPDLLVIGGGVALGRGEALLSTAAAVMTDGLRLVPAPQLRLSRLGPDSPLLGAIALAQRVVPPRP